MQECTRTHTRMHAGACMQEFTRTDARTCAGVHLRSLHPRTHRYAYVNAVIHVSVHTSIHHVSVCLCLCRLLPQRTVHANKCSFSLYLCSLPLHAFPLIPPPHGCLRPLLLIVIPAHRRQSLWHGSIPSKIGRPTGLNILFYFLFSSVLVVSSQGIDPPHCLDHAAHLTCVAKLILGSS